MALIIGIHCSDGVVIGTDSAAASDPLAPTASREFQQRIAIIDDRVIVAGTGAIGLGQRFAALTGQHWASKELQNKSAVEIGKMLSESALKDFSQTGIDPLRPSGKPAGRLRGAGGDTLRTRARSSCISGGRLSARGQDGWDSGMPPWVRPGT